MTIELSLRKRAYRSRFMAAVWLCLAAVILVGTFTSLPTVTEKTIIAVQGSGNTPPADTESKVFLRPQLYAVVIVALGLFAISFACFLLGRAAFVETELAARFSGFADALCVAGDNFERLEKAANMLMPEAKYLSVPDIFSAKDLQSLVEVLKELKPH